VKFLLAEVKRLRTELKAKCVEMQSIRDKEDLADQGKSGDSVTTNMEHSARVQELEQQIVDLQAELQQKEVESEGFEDTDSVFASRDLLNIDGDVYGICFPTVVSILLYQGSKLPSLAA
jgi:uncharacterized small protein (DUF1192 family)